VATVSDLTQRRCYSPAALGIAPTSPSANRHFSVAATNDILQHCAAKLSSANGTMTLDIRVFEPEHHAQARGLWESTEGVGLSEADSFENVRRFLERNPGLSFVATDNQLVVATILCGHDGRRGLIHHLAVASSHRRRGLGRALVRRALSALHQEGIQKCHLLVFNGNVSGRAFWDRIGAEERTALGIFSLLT